MFSPLPPPDLPEKLASYCLRIPPLKVTRMEIMAVQSNKAHDANNLGEKKERIKSKQPLFYYKIFCLLYQEYRIK